MVHEQVSGTRKFSSPPLITTVRPGSAGPNGAKLRRRICLGPLRGPNQTLEEPPLRGSPQLRPVIRKKKMEYIDDYPSCSRTYATLLIYPKGQHPDEITKTLGMHPTRISVKGDGPLGRKRVNGWFLSSQEIVESKDSRRHIDWLLDQIDPISLKITELQNSGARIKISCFWESISGNGGPTLSPKQMKRLASYNIELWWDIWFDHE